MLSSFHEIQAREREQRRLLLAAASRSGAKVSSNANFDENNCCILCGSPRKLEGSISCETAFGPLSLNLLTQTCVANQRPVRLTPQRLAFLFLLVSRKGEIVTKEEAVHFCNSASDFSFGEGKWFDVLTCNLRNALDRSTFGNCILTIHKVGKLFDPFPSQRLRQRKHLQQR